MEEVAERFLSILESYREDQVLCGECAHYVRRPRYPGGEIDELQYYPGGSCKAKKSWDGRRRQENWDLHPCENYLSRILNWKLKKLWGLV